MKNRLLTFLETIENSHSISNASEKLYLSQPYISRVIKKAEKQYDITLLNRNSHPISLTPAGHLMITYLRKKEKLSQDFINEFKASNYTDLPTLKLGITPPLGERFNLSVLPVLFSKFPTFKTKTLELSTADAEKLFKDNQLDLFVGNQIFLPDVHSTILYIDKQVLVLNKHSKLYQNDKVNLNYSKKDFEKINHENFIYVNDEQRYQNIINNYFNNIGISFYPKIYVRDSSTALKLACLGLGNMTTSHKVVKQFKNYPINFIDLPLDKTGITFSVSTRTNLIFKDALDFLIEYLTENFENTILDFE